MGQLIDDMLNLSRVTRGEMDWGRSYLTAMGQTIAADLQQTAPDRQVEFIICGRLGGARRFPAVANRHEQFAEQRLEYTGKQVGRGSRLVLHKIMASLPISCAMTGSVLT
jgi:hypothetical protein